MLEVNNLCFSYNKKADFIDNMSFKIGCGEHIILFGADTKSFTSVVSILICCLVLLPDIKVIYYFMVQVLINCQKS
ncbi:MAG: hypothetical protein BHW07_03270 [Clostridium sp. CAG_433_25_7]|nr:MAG: hypothetical protein BHW07_03270 [Clostridium sp. CAG_433_25_7]